MKRWKLTLEYDGTGFCGWQRQQSGSSVQGVIEEAIKKFSQEEVTVHVAGRTDSGVHALAQVAHFDLKKETTTDVIRDALNYHVRPHKVVVLTVEEVSSEFHARFKARQRRYRYKILNRRAPSALLSDYAWHIVKPLEVDAMQKAANLLLGKHDFSTFRAQFCQSNSPLKTLDAFEVYREDEIIILETAARSFLYHQVRNMAGTLMLVGQGQWSILDFEKAFAACDRTQGGPTAPAHGLFLTGVLYE